MLAEAQGVADVASRDPHALMFTEQRAAYTGGGKRIAVHPGRRGGKTEGFVLHALKVMQANPGCRIPYIALTRKSAENILWRTIEKINDRLGLGLEPRKSDLTWRAPNGAELFLIGANKTDEVEKLRGQAFHLVGIDEAGSFRATLLDTLVRDVLTWCLMDHNGTLVLVGTPGAACVGYFHDACTGKIPGWDVSHWTCLDNPHIPHAEEWLAELREHHGWAEDDPSYLREAMGRWVKDRDSLVYKWEPGRNGVGSMPAGYSPDSDAWTHVIGIDYGYVDACAWVVLAFRRIRRSGDKGVYAVESFKRTGLLPDEAASLTNDLVNKYNPARVVGDAGGLGKPYLEEARRRWGLPIVPADKSRKQAQIELVNDALRASRLHVILDCNRDLIAEMEILQWDLERVAVTAGGLVRHELRRVIDQRFEDHLCDAAQYAYGATYAYLNEAPAEKPPPDRSRDAFDDERDAPKRGRSEAGWLEARRKSKRANDWWKG